MSNSNQDTFELIEGLTHEQNDAFKVFMTNMPSYNTFLLGESSKESLVKNSFHYYPGEMSRSQLYHPRNSRWIKIGNSFSVEKDRTIVEVMKLKLRAPRVENPALETIHNATPSFIVWLYNAKSLENSRAISATWCVSGLDQLDPSEVLEQLQFLTEFMSPEQSNRVFGQ